MVPNDDFYDFPVYKILNSQEGKLILTNKFANSYLSVLIPEHDNTEENMVFLKKIISALGISWDSDCRVRSFENHTKINLPAILENDRAKYIIGFGIDKNNFDIQANLKYKKWNRFNSFNLLLSLRLSDLQNKVAEKRILWNELQNEFNEK